MSGMEGSRSRETLLGAGIPAQITGRQMSSRTRGPWRISAVLTVLSLVLPFVALLIVAPVGQAALLPACCRRHGKHQCAMRMTEGGTDNAASSASPRLARLVERCPYAPGAVPCTPNPLLWQPVQGVPSAFMQSGQTAICWRRSAREVFQDSANLKRGPPAVHISA